jgi:undecaprenyl-diphosphatase
MEPRHAESHPVEATALLVVGAVVALASAALFLWLAHEVAGGAVQRFDERVLEWLETHRSAALTSFFLAITALGSTPVIVTLTLGVAIALYLGRHSGMALAVVLTVLGGTVLSNLLKIAYRRARPDMVDHLYQAFGWSFPSGHTIGSVAFFTTIALLAAGHVRGRTLRAFLVGYALFIGLLVAVSRMYIGVHYPSDVAGGLLVGVTWSVTVVSAEHRWRHARRRRRTAA